MVGVAINLVLPKVVTPYATPEEIKPPTGNAKDLNMKQQLVHMMVHHGQVPVSSSIIVGAIVGLSVYIAGKIQYMKVFGDKINWGTVTVAVGTFIAIEMLAEIYIFRPGVQKIVKEELEKRGYEQYY